jgi:hypothetical protein
MGSELVSDPLPLEEQVEEGESHTGSALLTYTDIFNKHLPYYMAIGMSYDEYWNGDCTLTRVYQKIHDIKKKEQNHYLWLQGMYIYDALIRVAPILQAFAKKGTKPEPYPEEPYPLSMQEIREREERKARKRYLEMQARMRANMQSINKSFKKEGD